MSVRRSVAIDGLEIRVVEAGKGSPVLLLHGFTGSAESLARVAQGLRDGFRTLAPELPGHGTGALPDDASRYRMERCVDDLAALLERLDAAPAHVFGYSMGGRVALQLCARHPERVRSAVLVGASAGLADPAERAARRLGDEALAAAILREGVPAFVERWSRHPLFATQGKRLSAQALDAMRRQRLTNRAEGLAGSLRGMGTGAQEPLHDRLGGIETPLLLLAGSDDPKFQAIAESLAARLPRADVAFVPDAGHAAHLENPEDVVRRARRHFRIHDPNPNPGETTRW